MRMGVLCAAFRARRMDAGLVNELLGQGDTIVGGGHAKEGQLRAALQTYLLLGSWWFL
jgi:hypothetical protein